MLSSQAVCAAAITVHGDAPLKNIAVTIDGATLTNVVQDLSQKYGFEVEGIEKLNNADTLSASASGSLGSVLEGLLGSCNYMIVRSPDNKSGIERVIILNSTRGCAPRQNLKPNADGSIDIPSESSSPMGSMF
jgi:hypothetical protein